MRNDSMTALNRRVILSGVAGFTAAALLRDARAAPYPERPITLVVPFAPGGSTDILARLVAGYLHQALGQPVIVENRSCASGNIGTAIVARSATDGYTFLFNTMSVHTMNHVVCHDADRCCERLLPDNAASIRDQYHGVAPLGSGQQCSRIHHLREGQSGKDCIRFGRCRLDQPSVRCAIREDDASLDGG